MIEMVSGSIFEADVVCLINPVNCVGVMGGGLALAFKKLYPRNYQQYVGACRSGRLRPGQLLTFREDSKYIINFPTKDHFRYPSEMSYIISGLSELVKVIQEYKIESVAIPALGCGLGGLSWERVLPEIESAALRLPDVRSLIYSPHKNPYFEG